MNRKKSEIQITKKDAEYILGSGRRGLKIAENSVFCGKCCRIVSGMVTIINYEVFVDDLGGIILKGYCKNCGGHVGRYIESGEKLEELKRVLEIIKFKIN